MMSNEGSLSPESVLSQLKSNNITHVVWLPDSETNWLYLLMKNEPSIELVPVSREGQAFSVAAGLAVQDIIEKDDIFNRAKNLAPYFQKGLFSLQDLESVDNIRGYGMMGGIDMKMNTKPGKAGYECFKACHESGVNFKATGDCLIIAPQFICEEKHIDEIIDKLRTGITNYQKNQKN